MVVFPHRHVSPRGYMGVWGRLDESPGVSFLHGFTAGGDSELAVDGFDLGPNGAWGDVEALRHLPGGEFADEQPKDIEFALGQLPVELPLPRLARAKLPFLALEELREHAGVGKGVQDGPRLGEHRPGSGTIAARGPYRGERQQPDEGWPRAQAGQPSSHGISALQLLLGFFYLPAACERTP